MKEMTAYTSDTDLDNILDMIKEWTGDRVAKNLRLFVLQGKVKLELPSVDFESDRWDGTLLIHFVKPMSAADVINYIVNGTGADEMHFNNHKTLRLWWD